MSTPHWSRAALGLAACAGLAIIAGCASGSTTARGADGVSPRDSAAPASYGAQSPRGATRVNRLTREDIERSGTSDIAALIETRMAGVRVLRRGSDYSVEIRGGSPSFHGSSEALVLIDGAEGTLGSVSIHDIQSIEVLKDSAAAIYGVRGGSGVLLITTRR